MTHSRSQPAGRPTELSLAAVYLFYCRATPLGPFIARRAAADLEKSFSSTSTRLIREERFWRARCHRPLAKRLLRPLQTCSVLFACMMHSRDSQVNLMRIQIASGNLICQKKQPCLLKSLKDTLEVLRMTDISQHVKLTEGKYNHAIILLLTVTKNTVYMIK